MKILQVRMSSSTNETLRIVSALTGVRLQDALRDTLDALAKHFGKTRKVPRDFVLEFRQRDDSDPLPGARGAPRPLKVENDDLTDPFGIARRSSNSSTAHDAQSQKAVTIHLPDELAGAVFEMSKEANRPLSQIMRSAAEALAAYGEQHREFYGPFLVKPSPAKTTTTEGIKPAQSIRRPRNDATLQARMPASLRQDFLAVCHDVGADASSTIRALVRAAIRFGKDRKHLRPPFKIELEERSPETARSWETK